MPGRSKVKHTAGPTRKVEAGSGDLEVSTPVYADGQLAGHVTFVLNAERDLVCTWTAEPGVQPLRGFQAWSREG